MKVERMMSLRRGWCAFLFGAMLAVQAIAAPAADLEKAVALFNDARYQQAQELLLSIDRDGLSDDQKRQRDELVEAVRIAINLGGKAGQDLDDANKAYAKGDGPTARKLYVAVAENEYASADQKKAAREGIALLARQKELTEKAATSKPAEPAVTARPVAETTTSAPATTGSPREQARLARNRTLAADAIRRGDAAIKAGQYDEALTRFQEALQLVPNHPEALNGLKLVQQHRQVEGRGDLLDESVQRAKGRWMRTETMYAENERQIRKLINDQEYAQAKEKLEVTRRLLDAAKRDAQPEERYGFLSRQVDALGRFIASEEDRYNRDLIDKGRIEATGKERERREAVQKEKDQRIGQLMDQFRQLQRERDYRQAADVLREILVIDPGYQSAEFMLRTVEDSEIIQGQRKTHEQLLGKMQEAFLGAEKARTPDSTGLDSRYVVYPDESEWRMILNRDPFGAGLSGETDADRLTREKLATVIPSLEFEGGTSFEDVITFLREQGKFSIDVNWNALAAVNIDKTTDIGGLNLQSAKIETALQLLLENVGGLDATLGYDVVDGIVRVSTLDDLNSKTVTRVYDVRDLLIKIRSFRSENNNGGMMMGGMMGGMGGGMMGGMGGGMMGGMGGGMMGGGMGGGGYGGGGYGGGGGGYGGGSGGEEDEEGDEDREELVENLQKLIKNQIEPGTWKSAEGAPAEGEIGSMDIWNDRMIVTHTANAHRRLVELLTQLRESKDIQVMVEARFVTLKANFLEEIGVDLDMVLNQGHAGLDQAYSGGQAVVDPATGAIGLMPRRFGQLGYAPAAAPLPGVPLTSTATLDQPFGNVALVPNGSGSSWLSRHTTAVPIQNNTLALTAPVAQNVAGSTDLMNRYTNGPAFQMFGSFLDNIQVDFLLRATQLDARSSSVDAPRLVCYNGREGFVEVNSYQSYVASPGFSAVGGSGVGGQSARGQIPMTSSLPSGRTFSVLPTVSGDRRYVTMEVKPMVTRSTLTSIPINPGSNALAAFFQTPNFEIQQIKTTVSVPDEGTLLLGGLRQSAEEEVEAGVPVISKIPVLKRAYTNRSKIKGESVLLILVKPTIIIPEEQEKHAFEGLMTSDKTGG